MSIELLQKLAPLVLVPGRLPDQPWWRRGSVNLTDRVLFIQLRWPARSIVSCLRFSGKAWRDAAGPVDPLFVSELCIPDESVIFDRMTFGIPCLHVLPAVEGTAGGDDANWTEAEAFEPVSFFGHDFARRYLWILSQLPELKLFYPANVSVRSGETAMQCVALYFAFAGGRGALAAMADDDCEE